MFSPAPRNTVNACITITCLADGAACGNKLSRKKKLLKKPPPEKNSRK